MGKIWEIIKTALQCFPLVDSINSKEKKEADAAWEANSCSVTWNTESDGNKYHGFSYHTSGESLDCKDMPSKSDIMLEVEECAKMHSGEGAPTGCCKTTTSPGRWELRVSMNKTTSLTDFVNC